MQWWSGLQQRLPNSLGDELVEKSPLSPLFQRGGTLAGAPHLPPTSCKSGVRLPGHRISLLPPLKKGGRGGFPHMSGLVFNARYEH
jgi:hypothetical protein